MSDDEGENSRQRLPSRYTADGEEARWRRIWLYRGGGGGHIDDDGADPNQEVTGALPPLPDEVREEGKYTGRWPDRSGGEQLASTAVTAYHHNW